MNAVERMKTELGATVVDGGIEFSVFSIHATSMDLCLFDEANPDEEILRVRMTRDQNDIWHAFVPHLGAGTLYGYRANGPWSPQHGHFFNPRKLLLDPYAKAIHGGTDWHHKLENFEPDYHSISLRDSSLEQLRGVVMDELKSVCRTTLPYARPWEETVIYEMHVKGFSKLNEQLPEALRGTYAGLAHPENIRYLKELGVTTLQLMPVHLHLDDGFLLQKGLTNYWGYNTLSFFVPHSDYALDPSPMGQVEEFRAMVETLHKAGLEVILDVVYNHTSEGGVMGLTQSFRGLDNAAYYLLNDDCAHMNYTGCGNTMNLGSPPVLKMVLDSLRYWVEKMGVDGFRFDLGVTMGRTGELFVPGGPFFMAVQQDPILQNVKMIAEPWDLGPNGYQVGGFPRPWRELNGRFRDDVRRFWCGDPHVLADFAKRFCGSQDIYDGMRRGPLASVNFLTSHDGFTLRDLWTYHEKRNEANGEDNRDGDNQNHSWNAGVEGESEDPEILRMRLKLTRAALTTMFLSQGVPFLTAGDEFWRTQHGNNNAYCQDNELSWMSWERDEVAEKLLQYVKELIQLRQENLLWPKSKFLDGQWDPLSETRDVEWFDADGTEMCSETWHESELRFVAALGSQRSKMNALEPKTGRWWLLFNGSDVDCEYPLKGDWEVLVDSAQGLIQSKTVVSGAYLCEARSVACLVSK